MEEMNEVRLFFSRKVTVARYEMNFSDFEKIYSLLEDLVRDPESSVSEMF